MRKTRKNRKKFGGMSNFSLDLGSKLFTIYLPPYEDLNFVKSKTNEICDFLLKETEKTKIFFSAKQFDKQRIMNIQQISQTSNDKNVLIQNFMEIELILCIYFAKGNTKAEAVGFLGNLFLK